VIVTVVATEEEEEPELEGPSPLGTFELKRFCKTNGFIPRKLWFSADIR